MYSFADAITKKSSINHTFGRDVPDIILNHKTFWIRSTYYMSPTNSESVLPEHVYGWPPPRESSSNGQQND